jgi:hypothetical protein
MHDWFAAFARKQSKGPLEMRATGATRATPELTHCETYDYDVALDVARVGNMRATPGPGTKARRDAPAAGRNAVAHVAQPLPRGAPGRATTEDEKRQTVTFSVARVAHVAHQLDNPSHERPGGAWDAEDWRTYFDERAAIAEFDGGLPRIRAEAEAFACCVVEWMNRNPPAANAPDRCAHCGESMADHEALPFLNGAGGHVWMHDRCHTGWTALRKADAVRALASFGLDPPAGVGETTHGDISPCGAPMAEQICN